VEIDLKDLLRKIYKEISVLFKTRKIDIKILVSSDPLIVEGDKRQVRLILRELIQNALKFTENGGKVQIRLELQNDQIVYSVKDSGIGIPLDKQDIIFESFYEVQDSINHSSSTKDFMGGGLGIGLSLVKDIVHSMQGKILIESEPNKGTTFKILLPCKKKQQEKSYVSF
jgi:signal transduction histidine kinase